MSNKLGKPKIFLDLKGKDKDLTMFTITNLTLNEEENMVSMAIKLKRKVVTELVTTFLLSFKAMKTMFASFSSVRVRFVMVNMVKSLSSSLRSQKLCGLLNLFDIKI